MIFFATIQETKKNCRTAGLLISIIGCLLLFLAGRCYTDETMTGHTILEMLFNKNANNIAVDYGLSYTAMLRYGAGQWFRLFAPAILTIGFQSVMYYEKEQASLTYIMLRENTAVYCGSKLLAGMFTGGMISAVSYGFYILIIKVRLKEAFRILKNDDANVARILGYGRVSELALSYVVGVFLFGAMCFGFVYFVSIFFKDRYVLMCMPILIKYVIDQVFTVVSAALMRSENFESMEKFGRYNMSNLIPFIRSNGSRFTLLTEIIIIVLLFFIFLFVLKRRQKNGKTG